ncbi:shTK domain protein [Oesophagostomum dentatum]|uniref:ShTK domain protein n=1 Tax=Oesophagostomum dentatum TaxID=61180 RepID=A0A0B1S4N6_OESDE|nr:shTK domain protein [Oesophagostomum dentatum]
MDRDKHITMQWSNINPQLYDQFAVIDSKMFTSYGVQYDYASIMHYNAYSGALDSKRPTMVPKVDPERNLPLLGQRKAMSNADVEILNKMYCLPAGCDDTNIYCGAWALKDYCRHPNHYGWMVRNCRKSCNFCNTKR